MNMNINDLLEKSSRYINDDVINKMSWSGLHKVVRRKSGTRVELENALERTSNPILYRWLVKVEEPGKIKSFQDAFEKIHEKHIDLKSFFDQCKETRGGDTYYVLYFGKSKNGTSRITSQHLGTDMSKSTLRYSLCALFVPKNESDKEAEIDKLLEGSYFEWLEFDEKDKEYLACLEAICIALGHYPINIEGNPFLATHKDWETFLTEGRKSIKK